MPQTIPGKDDLKYNFAFNTLSLDPAIYWNQVNIPVYAVYGDGDIQVPVQRCIEELNRVFKPKQNLLTIKIYPNADHLIKTIPNRDHFDFPAYAQGYVTDMVQWLIEITK